MTAACSVQRIKELMGNLWGSFMAAFVEVIHGYYNMTFAAKMLVKITSISRVFIKR